MSEVMTGFPAYDAQMPGSGTSETAMEQIYGRIRCAPLDRESLRVSPVMPFPPSVLPRGQVAELKDLLQRQLDLAGMKQKLAEKLSVLQDARIRIAGMPDDQSATDVFNGLPGKAERLERIGEQISQALNEQHAIDHGMQTTCAAIAAAKRSLGSVLIREQRARAAKWDALMKEAETISREMDALEAESHELGLAFPVKGAPEIWDPLWCGGSAYFRASDVHIAQDGRRSTGHSMGNSTSEYRRERERKVRAGLLEAV